MNSTCATVTNITSSTGNNFGTVNGIGYFNKNGSTFPFDEGVVLSTGNAASTPGPNTTILGDGTNAWPGDPQLNAIILAATGDPMNSQNASKLEFDFVPIINTLSFNFIFASEEYGTFQCLYSDAFAFLLTNVATGVTTNLAVLPNTTIPISVVTIRNNLYNNGCASANQQYFGNYYDVPNGQNPLGAPINFNGMTVPLTASSPVIPGQLYHIKLVVADRQDTAYDSAVFIEGGSFNIGTVDLGSDLLTETNNAVCYGETQVLNSGLNPADFTFIWSLNGVVIPNQTNPSISVNTPGTYSLSALYNNTTCSVVDSVLIEYYPEVISGQASNLVKCGINGVATFDLTSNNTPILNGNSPLLLNVKYFLTQADAQANTNAIANPAAYENISNPQTIYYQLANAGDCAVNGSFTINVQQLTEIVFTLPTQVCQNSAALLLPSTSDNNISGTWSPAVFDTTQTGTYTFTASANSTLCTDPYVVTIEVLNTITPTFLAPSPICIGDVAPVLPLTSENGITGTWSPNVVSNTQTGTYTFTPTGNPCAVTTQLVVTVYQDCSFGSYANAVWLTDCDSNGFFNTMGSGTSIIGPVENIFPSSDLGTYVSNSSSLKLRGAELKTFKVATSNVCSATLFYRVYPTGGIAGGFSSLPLPFFDDCNGGTFPTGGPCSPGDQKWQNVLSDANNPIDLTAFPAGDYNLEIYYQLVGDVTSVTECDDTLLIDNGGANFIATYTLQNNPTYTSVNPTTCVAADGSITIAGLAPSTTYSFTHSQNGTVVGPINITSDNQGNYTINGLTIGEYSTFTYLVNGCTISSTDVITLTGESDVVVVSTNPTACNSTNGTITISGLLPSQPYVVNYTADTVAVGPITITSNASGEIIIGGLGAGTYSNFNLVATNCSASSNDIVTLINPDAPIVSVNSSTICASQTATVTATPEIPGTYNYVWNVPTGAINPGNVPSFTTAIAGTYTVVMTPLSTTFCNGSFEEPLTTGQFPNMLNQNDVPCWNTSAADGIMEVWPPAGFENVFPYDGSNFIEMNGNSVATISQDFTTSLGAALNISFAHRGRQGTDVIRVEIGPVGGPYVSLGNFSDGQAWTLYNLNYIVPASGSTNYTIRFVSVSSAGTDLTVGNFLDAVSVTSIACSSNPTSGTVTFLPAATLTLSSANNEQTICIDSAITAIDYTTTSATNATVTGLPNGVSFNFDVATGSISITGTATETGTFNYIVSSINDCNTVVLNGTIIVNPLVTPTFDAIAAICSGDTLSDLPTTSLQGIIGTWSPALNNLQTTEYTFTPTDAAIGINACATVTTLTIVVNQPVASTFNGLASICIGTTAPALPATSIEGFTGTWNPAVIDNTASATYTFTPTAGQCASVGTLNFVVTPADIPSTFSALASICIGTTAPALPATSIEGFTGTWNPAVIDNTASATYTFTPDAGQCAIAGTLNFVVTSANIPATFSALEPICNGATAPSLPVTSIEGFTGTWNPAVIDNAASATYTFTPDAGQCAIAGTLNFVVTPTIVSNFNDVSICLGANLDFPTTSLQGFTGSWTPNTISTTQSASYTFTPNAGQCAAVGIWNVTVLPNFDFAISGSCVGSSYTLEATSLNNSIDLSTANFTWLNSDLLMVGANEATFNVSEYLNSTTIIEPMPITFSVVITNSSGCTVTKSFTVDNVMCDIQKGISVNNDGLNDSFDLSGFNVKKLTIYNRYGMKVYSKNSYTNQWLGQSDKGDELPDATYYYVIEFNGSGESKTGWIYLNREN